MRRLLAMTAAGIAVLAGAGAAWSNGLLPLAAGQSAEPSQTPAVTTETAEIERRTLENREELDGTLGFAGELLVGGSLPGLITWLPDEGTVIDRGDRLYEVNGTSPVVLLLGSRPAWRTMNSDTSNGPDIRQLEQNLKELGYARSGMKVDNHWGPGTTAAVKRWQRAAGVDDDGSVELGEVVFLPTSIRVTKPALLGSPAAGTVLEGTTTERVVTVELSAQDQDLVEPGLAVEIELPDRTTTAGRVASIGRVAHPGESSGFPGEEAPATIDVTISLDDPSAAGELDQAPVTVQVVTSTRPNVLTVPVTALLALLEGGYAVQVVDADGGRRYVQVDLGLFQDGWVEVRGDGLEAGQKVAVPA